MASIDIVRGVCSMPRRKKPAPILPEASVVGVVYTTEEVAQLLKVSPRTVQYWIKQKRLRAVRIGREWRVEAHALREFMDAGRSAS
jgi:excisionase family DNA binding protein